MQPHEARLRALKSMYMRLGDIPAYDAINKQLFEFDKHEYDIWIMDSKKKKLNNVTFVDFGKNEI